MLANANIKPKQKRLANNPAKDPIKQNRDLGCYPIQKGLGEFVYLGRGILKIDQQIFAVYTAKKWEHRSST